MGDKQVPISVKIISILYWVGSIFVIIYGILWLYLLNGFGGLNMASGYILGGIFLFFGIIGIFVARGLWNGVGWTRIAAIIFSFIVTVIGIYLMIQGNVSGNLKVAIENIGVYYIFIFLFINLVIGIYLLFSGRVKEAFA